MKIPQDQSSFKKFVKITVLVAVILFVFFTAYKAYKNAFSPSNGFADIKSFIHRAELGDFKNTITAFGELKSESRRNIVAQVEGTIAEIFIRPGSAVELDTVILLLNNPKLEREYESLRLELDETTASFEQLNAELADQELTLKNDVLITESEMNTQQSELDAKNILYQKQIISALELKRETIKFEHSKLKYELAKQKYKTFEKTKTSKIDVALLRKKGIAALLDMKLVDLESLKIKAGMRGILQSIEKNIELGQRLEQGSNIGVVANLDTLYAEIRVSASDAPMIKLGMNVNIDIKGMQAQGIISRVAPTVVRNQVQVDVKIISSLPVTARPDVEIQAAILLENKKHVVVLPRPPHFEVGIPMQLYIKSAPDTFELRTVEVGLSSNNTIEITHGVIEGDDILLVDPEKFGNKKIITI